MAQNIETEATILSVEDDARWKYSIEAEIPAFDGDRSYKYLAWKKDQGPPPQVGATGLGTFEGYARSKFYVDRGDLAEGPYDGTESTYMVTWNMIGFSSGAANGAAPTPTPTGGANAPLSRSSDAPGTLYQPAPTRESKAAEALAKWRREVEGINDRKAISDVLALAEAGTYTLDGLLEDAERLAGWYNTRLAARCESALVEAAQAAGAVVTSVTAEPIPVSPRTPTPGIDIKNRAQLGDWVVAQGWSKAQISGVLMDAGYADSSAYLDDLGNSAQGLAEVLYAALGDS